MNSTDEDKNFVFERKLRTWQLQHDFPRVSTGLLANAFTHPSYKSLDPSTDDYQRLEFLGDAVLQLVVSDILFTTTDYDEGDLTARRRQLVSKEYLARAYDVLDLESFTRAVLPELSQDHRRIKIKSDYVEAFLACQWIENGYNAAKKSWLIIQKRTDKKTEECSARRSDRNLSPEQLKERSEFRKVYESIGLKRQNAISMLNELCQVQHIDLPEYQTIDCAGEENERRYRVEVTIKPFVYAPSLTFRAIGKAHAKHRAKKIAAEKLCDRLYIDYVEST